MEYDRIKHKVISELPEVMLIVPSFAQSTPLFYLKPKATIP